MWVSATIDKVTEILDKVVKATRLPQVCDAMNHHTRLTNHQVHRLVFALVSKINARQQDIANLMNDVRYYKSRLDSYATELDSVKATLVQVNGESMYTQELLKVARSDRDYFKAQYREAKKKQGPGFDKEAALHYYYEQSAKLDDAMHKLLG